MGWMYEGKGGWFGGWLEMLQCCSAAVLHVTYSVVL